MQFAISVRIAKIRNVLATLRKFAMPISQCEFRNANFAMPILPISQCEFRNANFAMPISNSQCQYTVHLSHKQNLSEISHCEIRKPLCQIRNPLPKFAISVGIAKFTLRNLQALSCFVINAEPPSIFGVLLFYPIT